MGEREGREQLEGQKLDIVHMTVPFRPERRCVAAPNCRGCWGNAVLLSVSVKGASALREEGESGSWEITSSPHLSQVSSSPYNRSFA